MSTPTSNASRRRIVVGTSVFVGLVVALVAFSWLNSLRVPEIVRGSSAGGGRWGACPSAGEVNEQGSREEALSPEFNARLAKRFPKGSPEKNLIDALQREGFTPPAKCELDTSIKWAEFRLNGNEVVAQAYWQVDEVGGIVWTKGFVAYTFL